MVHPKIIYTLSHPLTGQVVYVGSTQDLYKRLVNHVNDPSEVLSGWISDLKNKMLCPIIEEVDRVENITSTEIYWIQQFLAWGFPLFNRVGRPETATANVKFKKTTIRKQVRIDRQEMIGWLKVKEWGDLTKIHRQYGVVMQEVSYAMSHGVCSKKVYEALKHYYTPKEAA